MLASIRGCIFVIYNPLTQVSLNGSLAQVNPPVYVFSQMIDNAAEKYFNELMRYKTEQDSILRFSCYTAVSGRSEHIALSDEPRTQHYLTL